MLVAEGRALHIQTPRVFLPLLEPARDKGAYGGRVGAKSHFFADLLIDDCIRIPGLRAVCVREYQTTLKQSVKLLLEDKIRLYNLTRDFTIFNSHIEAPGGGQIIFQGMQSYNADSIKSLEGFDRAWVEEAQSLSLHSLNLLRPTIFRKAGAEIWYSWNPRLPTDPVDNLFRGNAPRKPGQPPWAPLPSAILVRSSYKDNPWVVPELLREIDYDRAHDPEKYAHVWMGEYERRSESRVFKNWTVEDFETPDDVTFYYGGDWGFSADPTVLVRCWLAPTRPGERQRLMIDREVYKIGCEIDHTPALFDTLDGGEARKWVITADSARPETISYLKRHGYPRIEPAVKGANSVKEGVIFLQSYDVVIHERCSHTIDEFTLYSYKTDTQTGDVIPILEDKKNHVIDSVRYAVEKLRKPTGEFVAW